MSTLQNKKYIKNNFYMLLFTIFFGLFGAVYEKFSHEVYSYYMIYAFAIPLLLGILPYTILSLNNKIKICNTSIKLWNFGIISLTIGSIVRGIIDIYGTTNKKLIVYLLAGIVLLLASVIYEIFDRIDNR